MKKLSHWAKANPWRARIIIVLLHFLLIYAAGFTGSNLRSISVSISPVFNGLAIAFFIAALFCYPAKKSKIAAGWIGHYAYQKSCDLILTFAGLFMICYLFNGPSDTFTRLTPLNGAYPFGKEQLPPVLRKSNSPEQSVVTYPFSKKERKTLLRELRSELKTFFKANSSREGKIALIVLTVVVSIALLFLVAGLSCNLSCSGNEGAAMFVLIFGFAAVIALMVVVIRKINRRQPRSSFGKRTERTLRGA